MATQGGLQDELLANLAEDIETSEQVESLGRALGFSTAAINRYTETNIKSDRMTCKGTRDMLFDWRQKVKPNYQHLRLNEALINAELVMLADTHLKDTPSISDIYSKKISESLTVGQCREKLANKYMNSFGKLQKAPWDPNDLADLKDLHTVVTMVKKDAHGKNTKTKEILLGSVDEIFSAKVNGRLPLRILISAPAGRGKTTAVAKMAYDWANRVQGSSLENLPLLFVVKLRNTNRQASIAEAIRSQLLSDVLDLTQDGLHRFIADNQDICHIILDGLDEYAGIAANQGLRSNMVDVMQWTEYPHCRVLVTTRPHLENFFNEGELPKVYTKMWIEGFSRDNSREYIDKFFTSSSIPSKGQSLKDYLDDKPLINELVITPLFCLMVCHLWSENLLENDTTTQTELLDNVNIFLMHHANNKQNLKDKITSKKLRTVICKLGKVALDGLLDDAKKLVFTPHDFRSIPAVLDRACEIGIISRTNAQITGLPQTHETLFTSIEFYHKLAQEHSAGKSLAAKTNKYLLRWKISKLDKVLQKIRANICDYENLIRFAAGTKNILCIRVMEEILANSFLDESERYRILLDCSSEIKGTEQGVSSLVQRCVSAQRILLKSPTVYTAVGMQNLPGQLKQQVTHIRMEGSVISFDVTNSLWASLGSFGMLHTITILDSSLNFPSSPPELPSVTKLKAERVTSKSYEGLISSLPSLKEIDVTTDDVEGHTSQITASSPIGQTGDQQLAVHIKLQGPSSLSREQETESGIAELGLLIREPAGDHQWLQVTGMCGQEEALVNIFIKSTYLKSLNVRTSCGSLNSDRQAENISSLTIRNCKLTTLITSSVWSCLRSFLSLDSLTISDSSLSFPPSPPELTFVTKLDAKRVTSQSYEGLLSSLPSLKEIDVTIDDVEGQTTSIKASSPRGQTSDQQLPVHIKLQSNCSLSREKETESGIAELGLLIRDPAGDRQWLQVTGMCGQGEEALVNIFIKSTYLKSLNVRTSCGSLNSDRQAENFSSLTIRNCILTGMITSSMWSCLRTFPSLDSLTISDSCLSSPPSPPELTSITNLTAERVTSQSYEGLLSSLPGLEEISITMNDAERDISQITAGLRRTGGQQLTHISLHAQDSLPPVKKTVSRETMRGLGLLIREQTKNLQWLWLDEVKCTDEEDLVYLIECCRHVKEMETVLFGLCGTKKSDRLDSHLKSLRSSGDALRVQIWHDDASLLSMIDEYQISHIH